MSDGACCAHLRLSYRTELVDAPGLVGMTKATRGWWECDLGCGAKFVPEGLAKRVERESYAAGFEAGQREMRERAAGFVHSTDLLIRIAIANAIRALPLTGSPSTDIAPPREGEAK